MGNHISFVDGAESVSVVINHQPAIDMNRGSFEKLPLAKNDIYNPVGAPERTTKHIRFCRRADEGLLIFEAGNGRTVSKLSLYKVHRPQYEYRNGLYILLSKSRLRSSIKEKFLSKLK